MWTSRGYEKCFQRKKGRFLWMLDEKIPKHSWIVPSSNMWPYSYNTSNISVLKMHDMSKKAPSMFVAPWI